MNRTKIELKYSLIHSIIKLWNIKIETGFIKSILLNIWAFTKSRNLLVSHLALFIVGLLSLRYQGVKVGLSIGLRNKRNFGDNGIRNTHAPVCKVKNIVMKPVCLCLYRGEEKETQIGRADLPHWLKAFVGHPNFINGVRLYWKEIIGLVRTVGLKGGLMPITLNLLLNIQNWYLRSVMV